MHGRLFRTVSLWLLCLMFSGGAFAQSRPEAVDIEASFGQYVPAGWELGGLIIEVQENYGTEVEPDIASRFRATVVLLDDTFELTGELEGASLLRPVLTSGEERVFFGVARSIRRLGEWETSFTLENNPTQATGSVLDSFAGRRLIVGSDEEAEYRASLEAEAEARTQASIAELARQERLRAEERVAELAEVGHDHALRQAEEDAANQAELTRIAQEQAYAAALREQETSERAARDAEMDALLTELISEMLPAELRVQLAGHWNIKEIETVGSTRRGSLDNPEFTVAFAAELELLEDTFTSREVEGGGLLLSRLQSSGADQQLNGSAHGTWNADTWALTLEFDNLDGFADGLPRGYYPATAVVEGSSAEAAYWRSVEEAAEEALERELAAIDRQAQLDAAQHEAARTAAAQAAQLEAIELAARAAEFAALEQALIESPDIASRFAAFDAALASGDQSLRWLAIEAALRSDEQVLIGRAIPLALASGNTGLNDLALARILLDGGGIAFRRTNPNVNLLLSDLRLQSDGTVTGTLAGRNTSDFENRGGAADELECGVMTGTLRNGHLALSSAECDFLVQPLGTTQLQAQVLSRRNYSWSLTSQIPAYVAPASE